MAEIRVGQVVTLVKFDDDNEMYDCSYSLVGKQVKVTAIEESCFDFEHNGDTYGWPLSAIAIDEPQPRRIALTLAKDTTETECGACPFAARGPYPRSFCDQFDALREPLDSMNQNFRRLPECIAAEVTP